MDGCRGGRDEVPGTRWDHVGRGRKSRWHSEWSEHLMGDVSVSSESQKCVAVAGKGLQAPFGEFETSLRYGTSGVRTLSDHQSRVQGGRIGSRHTSVYSHGAGIKPWGGSVDYIGGPGLLRLKAEMMLVNLEGSLFSLCL